MLDLGLGNAFFQRCRKVFDDHDRLGTRVLELVLQFTRRVQGVDVHHHKTRTQNGRHSHGVLRHVGHHDGDAVAFAQAQRLQVSGQA